MFCYLPNLMLFRGINVGWIVLFIYDGQLDILSVSDLKFVFVIKKKYQKLYCLGESEREKGANFNVMELD